MGVTFNAGEIFQIALQIERNGRKFYTRAAEATADEAQKKLLLDLARRETEHEEIFEAMREELTEAELKTTDFDPDGTAVLYLQAAAGGHIFDLSADPAAWMAGKNMPQVLEKALGLEKESVIFYQAMKEVVPGRLGRDKIDGIVGEEMRHVAIIGQELARAKRR